MMLLVVVVMVVLVVVAGTAVAATAGSLVRRRIGGARCGCVYGDVHCRSFFTPPFDACNVIVRRSIP